MSQPGKDTARERFVKACLERDGKGCRVCCCGNNAPNPRVHQITDDGTMPYGGHVMENGITLCARCRHSAEVFPASGGVDFIPGFHPHDLYARVGSSFQAAYAACIRSGAKSKTIGRLSVYYGDDGKPIVASLRKSLDSETDAIRSATSKTLDYTVDYSVLINYNKRSEVIGVEILDPSNGHGELNKTLEALHIMDLLASEKKALRGEAATETA